MIRILHVISPGSGNFGGIESFLMNYYSNMDHERVHFDFAFCGANTMKLHMEDEVFIGSSFTELNALNGSGNNSRNWKRLVRELRTLVRSSKYHVVEVHTASPMIQAACGVALRSVKGTVKIAHSHALQEPTTSSIKSLISRVCVHKIKRSYDFFFACSNAAGEMYGAKVLNSNRFKKINNAIDLSLFQYDENLRRIVREEQDIKDGCFVIGHVARLSEEKNQVFLVDVFDEIRKIKNNCILWIVGEGPARADIEKRIDELHLSDSAILLGQRVDVPRLLQAMDAFVITSRLEGLCISAIESQAAGLPTFVSSGVPEECRVTECFEKLSLSDSKKLWAEHIAENANLARRNMNREIQENGYDICMTARELEEFYCGL